MPLILSLSHILTTVAYRVLEQRDVADNTLDITNMNKMETSPGINSKLAESLEVNETTLPSTRISMVTDPVKINEESSPGCDRDNSAQKQNEEVSSDEYPQGFRLACIVTALALTIFLGSLDMVLAITHAFYKSFRPCS